MDDIKLYAKSEQDIDLQIDTTRIYSTDNGMGSVAGWWLKRGKVAQKEQ